MTILDRLNSIRLDYPECTTLTFTDVSTQTVLASSHRADQKQEHLDDLCATAVDMFGTATSPDLSALLSPHGQVDEDLFHVIIMEQTEVGIFLRSVSNPTDAFCCVCAPGIDIPAFISAARQHLEDLGGDS